MRWSRWTGLLMVGWLVPATALACTPHDTAEPAAAVSAMPPIPGPHAPVGDGPADATVEAAPDDTSEDPAADEAPAAPPDVAAPGF